MHDRPIASGMLIGAGALALSFMLQLGFDAMLDQGVLLLLLSCIAPLPGLFAAIAWMSDAVWRLACGAALMLLLPFGAASLPETRVLGTIATVTVEEAPSAMFAAALLLPGAAPDETRQRRVPGFAGSTYLVAPVLGGGWSRAGAVGVVAVQEYAEGQDAARWAASGGIVRLLPEALRANAVRQALAESGLQPAPGMVIGRWVPDPTAALLDSAIPVLVAYGAGVVVWSLLLLIPGDKRLRGRHRHQY